MKPLLIKSTPPDSIDFSSAPPFPPHAPIEFWFSEPLPNIQIAESQQDPSFPSCCFWGMPEDLQITNGSGDTFDADGDTVMRLTTLQGFPINHEFALWAISVPPAVGEYIDCIPTENPDPPCVEPLLSNIFLSPTTDGTGAPLILAAGDTLEETSSGSGIYWGTYLEPSGSPGAGNEPENIEIQFETARVRIDNPLQSPLYSNLSTGGEMVISGIYTYNVSSGVDVTAIELLLDGSSIGAPDAMEDGDTGDDFGTFTKTISLSPGQYEFKAVATSSDGLGGFDVINANVVSDHTDPVVTIVSPGDSTYVNTSDVTVEVTASDTATGIAWVKVNGEYAQLDGDTFSITFSDQDGEETYIAEASDGVGNIGGDSVSITVDTDAPVVSITSPSDEDYVNTRNFLVIGTVYDDSPIASLTINGMTVSPTPEDGGTFSFYMPTLEDGMIYIQAGATDMAGNGGYSSVVGVVVDTIAPYLIDSNPPNYPWLRTKYYCPTPPTGEPCPVPSSPNLADMPSNQSIILTFSEPLNPDDLPSQGQGSTLDDGNDMIVFEATDNPLYADCIIRTPLEARLTLSEDQLHLIIDPTIDSLPGGTYQVMIESQYYRQAGDRIADSSGNPLDLWPWNKSGECSPIMFHVESDTDDSDPPAVAITPDNNETDVSPNIQIIASFDEAMNPLTLDTTTFLVNNHQTSGEVSGSVLLLSGSTYKEFIFSPLLPLEYDTQYDVTITTGVEDLAGNNLASVLTSSFTTAEGDTSSDSDPPVIVLVTLNDIDTLFNCRNDPGVVDNGLQGNSISWLVVPRTGFSINIKYSDSGVGIDPELPGGFLTVLASDTLGENGDIPANTNLASFFSVTSSEASLTVSNDVLIGDTEYDLTFPGGGATPREGTTISIKVKDKNGNETATTSYYFQVVEATDDLLPFETRQHVYLDFSRDYWDLSLDLDGSTYEVNYVYGDTGRPDVVDELIMYGLNIGDTVMTEPTGELSTNQVVLNLIKARLKQRLDKYFGILSDGQGHEVLRDENSVDIEFHTDISELAGMKEPYSPDTPRADCLDGNTWCDAPPLYGGSYYSSICIGGKLRGSNQTIKQLAELDDASTGLGQADPHNRHNNNDCGRVTWDGDTTQTPDTSCYAYRTQPPSNLGVFFGLQRFIWYNFDKRDWHSSLYKLTFDPFNSMYTLPICNVEGSTAKECLPIGGYTIGEDNLDAIVLDPTFDRTQYSGDTPEARRYDQIMAAVDGYSRLLAALTAHELGHTLGVAIGGTGGNYGNHPYPPYYAFGGYATAFPGTGQPIGHVFLGAYEAYGYFPGASASIMDASKIGGYEIAVNELTSYTSYDKAYLLQKTFYLGNWPHAGCYLADCGYRATATCFLNPAFGCIDQCPAP